MTVNLGAGPIPLTERAGALGEMGVTRIMVSPRLGRVDESAILDWIDEFASATAELP